MVRLMEIPIARILGVLFLVPNGPHEQNLLGGECIVIHVYLMHYPLDRSVRETGPAAKATFIRQPGCFLIVEGGFCQFFQMPMRHFLEPRRHIGQNIECVVKKLDFIFHRVLAKRLAPHMFDVDHPESWSERRALWLAPAQAL